MKLRLSGLGPFSLLLLCLASLRGVHAQEVYGVVTDAGSPDRFQVNGITVLCLPSTEVQGGAGGRVETHLGCEAYRLGQSLAVYGKRHKQTVQATKLEAKSAEPHKVQGFAVIDLQPVQDGGGWNVRADGYRLRIGSKAHTQLTLPLKSMGDVRAGMWVRYAGTHMLDGTVEVETSEFTPGNVTRREAKLREKREFDPAATTEGDRQSGLSKAFLGLDPKRFPASNDEALQQRVATIGERLVPTYQKAMPDDDPSKLHFRFQVVDQPKLHDGWTMANGIILMPQQVLARLENDDQIAALLADNIAVALEKQELREAPVATTLNATEIAGIAGGFFVPGLGLATGLGAGVAGEKVVRRLEEQSGRVSLQLLHDAGFDMTQAPRTWWLLASTKPKPLEKIDLPYRAAYLYGQLFTTWPAPQPPASMTSITRIR